jgi:hypothetical protein
MQPVLWGPCARCPTPPPPPPAPLTCTSSSSRAAAALWAASTRPSAPASSTSSSPRVPCSRPTSWRVGQKRRGAGAGKGYVWSGQYMQAAASYLCAKGLYVHPGTPCVERHGDASNLHPPIIHTPRDLWAHEPAHQHGDTPPLVTWLRRSLAAATSSSCPRAPPSCRSRSPSWASASLRAASRAASSRVC